MQSAMLTNVHTQFKSQQPDMLFIIIMSTFRGEWMKWELPPAHEHVWGWPPFLSLPPNVKAWMTPIALYSFCVFFFWFVLIHVSNTLRERLIPYLTWTPFFGKRTSAAKLLIQSHLGILAASAHKVLTTLNCYSNYSLFMFFSFCRKISQTQILNLLFIL